MSSERKTGIIYDHRMSGHECIWDQGHIETPLRYSFPLKKCEEYRLLDRCIKIPSKFASEEELLLVHDKNYIEDIKRSKLLNDPSDLEDFASSYDSVYFNSKTYDASLLSAGCTLQLVSSVLSDQVNNGMAIVRPPGHHAMTTDACGFCFFNNVAVAAKYALEHCNLSRILIVDWDIHHGQGTQRMFYNDPRVLYFSIHRYENGAFWPHLRESNFDYAGGPSAKGFNINVPLNGTGQGNAEYLAIFNNVLLPIAYEFAPELVIISAGYDSAYGCPEGEMKVYPSLYPHLINSLSCLANGRICVVLEGGYCIPSLSESVALTLRALLGDPCPIIPPCISISQVTVNSVLNVLSALREYWDSVKLQPLYKSSSEGIGEKHFVHVDYTGSPLEGSSKYVTRGYNPVVLSHVKDLLESELKDIISKTDLSVPTARSCFIFSSKHKHSSLNELNVSGEGIKSAVNVLKNFYECGILSKCTWLELTENTETDLTALVNLKGVNKIKSTWKLSDEVRMKLEQNYSENACKSISDNLLQLVDAVVKRVCVNGFSLTYAVDGTSDSENKAQFCKFNEVALAASYLIEQHFMKRILIIDWSVDHNNNTQKIFYEDDKVLSISLHYCGKKICPMSIDETGVKQGKGYNVNVPFTHAVTDGDYLAALFHIILPIAYEFGPEFILISSAFNNECFSLLSPSCYGIMVKLLSSLCNGKMIIDFEGWNHNNTFDETTCCISSLLGNSELLSLNSQSLKPCSEAIETIQKVIAVQRKFWRSLAFAKFLPDNVTTESKKVHTVNNLKRRQSSDPVAIPRKLDEAIKMEEWIGEASGFSNNTELFCVVPLEYCPHLELLQPIPTEGLNPFARCYSCNDPNENWVCLHCYQVYCGRFINQHMLQHGQDMKHVLTLSYVDLSVWCYACDAYIHNELIAPIKEHAHIKKFGSL
ncbi:histone deacetylase 6 [Parasteatoda tepidariorum]|uniref:histone deacetylase 6 n=1 Tax=Parasteatoda tepidariorum TaxID=114398 RepID=UPI001C71F411|nr:histone deacetylase 6 [Parasteatoda tepidariorum]